MLPEAAAWGRTFTANGLKYEEDKYGDFYIAGPATTSGTIEHLVIPAEVTDPTSRKTYSVSTIGPGAFKGLTINRMTIEPSPLYLYFDREAMAGASVSTLSISRDWWSPVNHEPFHYMSSLTSVTFGEGVHQIRSFSFPKTSLTSVTIPASVRTIGTCAFEQTQISSVKFAPGGNLEEIWESAFAGCQKLLSIDIPEGVTYIGRWAFSGTLLTSVYLPSTLKEIYEGAFNCPLVSVKLSPFNPYFKYKDGLLTSADGKTAVMAFHTNKSITVLEGVTTIAVGAFENLKVQKVTLPSTLKEIKNGAFIDCRELNSINLPEGLGSIDDWGFAYCI